MGKPRVGLEEMYKHLKGYVLKFKFKRICIIQFTVEFLKCKVVKKKD